MSNSFQRPGLRGREFTRREVLAGAAAASLASILAACGSKSSGSADTTAGAAAADTTAAGSVAADTTAAAAAAVDTTAAAATAAKGGTLRFGYNQATVNDTLDLPKAVNDFMTAIGRQMNVGIGKNRVDGTFNPILAEEVTNASPTEVVVRLRQGLEFHNGKTITADDVLASYRRMADPKEATSPGGYLADLDLANSKVVDERTVKFVLTKPNAFIMNGLGHNQAAVYPGGVYDAANPVGAGPFKLKKHTPGTSAEFERFANYPTPALLDGLIIQNFADTTAMANALTGGTIDAIGKLPSNLVNTLGDKVKVLSADTGGWGGFVLDASKKPFDDPRVRLAFKLLVDRTQMIGQLQGGKGAVGNDLTSPNDAVYIGKELTQRVPDVEKAKSLLKEAGVEGLKLDIAVGGLMPNLEVVLAEQLRAGGITLNVKQVDSTTYFANHYGKDAIYTTLWPTLSYSAQVASSLGPNAYYPEGNWVNKEFQTLWTDAQSDLDETSRNDKLKQMQRLFFEDGTYLIWGFQTEIDAMVTNLQGGDPDASGWPFKGFDFTQVSFS